MPTIHLPIAIQLTRPRPTLIPAYLPIQMASPRAPPASTYPTIITRSNTVPHLRHPMGNNTTSPVPTSNITTPPKKTPIQPAPRRVPLTLPKPTIQLQLARPKAPLTPTYPRKPTRSNSLPPLLHPLRYNTTGRVPYTNTIKKTQIQLIHTRVPPTPTTNP